MPQQLHDLKTPLASATAVVQLLRHRARRGSLQVEEIDERLAAAENSLRRAGLHIDELIELSANGHEAPVPIAAERTDLVALARGIAAGHRGLSEKHKIVFEAESEAIVGTWDPARLERCLDNLFNNALKFSPRGGTIRISVSEERSEGRWWAVATVSDEGIGIPSGDLAGVFGRFHRAANAHDLPGSGLGLWSVRRIVEQHSGTVSVSSREGEGSAFTIRLPIVEES